MQRGRVLSVDGQPLSVDAVYRPGLCVRYFREVAKEVRVPFAEHVLYRDVHLLVADKPHFLPVTPAGHWVEETLLGRLQRKLGLPDLAPLHRIDRATAGLVLFSVDPANRAAYQALFRERRIEKRYEALAPALPRTAFPLWRCSRLVAGEPFFRMREADGAPNSETRVDILRRDGDIWRYALYPRTGKQHQLRVHMAMLGAPILNDRFYPALTECTDDDYARPLQLLAQALDFIDPLSGERRRFASTMRLAGNMAGHSAGKSSPP